MSILSLPLISFFLSLAGIALMIGHKVMRIRDGKIINNIEHSHHSFVLDWQKIVRQGLVTGLVISKRFGYLALFMTFRFFIKSFNFIKIKSKILLKEIKNRFRKDASHIIVDLPERREVSKYLKIISEYRQKIRKMRHRIKEEEGIE